MKAKSLDQAYAEGLAEGHKAFEQLKSDPLYLPENPYIEDSDNWVMWMDGFYTGYSDAEEFQYIFTQ